MPILHLVFLRRTSITCKREAVMESYLQFSSAPSGPPAGIPQGPPSGYGTGSPQGMPQRPPTGVPQGPPPGLDFASGALNVSAFAQEYAKIILSGEHDHLAMWFLDIRNFRSINPKFGFMVGNVVLQTIARCIREELTHGFPVARLGGDRFIALTTHMDFEAARAAFEHLCKVLNEEVNKEGVNQRIVPCAGIYFLREDDLANTSQQIPLDYASIAHRHAHEESHDTLVQFTQEDLERDQRRVTIEQCIDLALLDGQIQVWFQPQVDYALGEIIGAEALARWQHPDLGLISPREFIPILENCGKIHDLDLYVWEEACRCAGKWRSISDGKPVPISVNVSRAEMFEEELLEHFLDLQQKYDLPKGSLRLEITEGAFVEEADGLYRVIEHMRSNDMIVEMDDFGSGLSSLNMLKDVPVDVVKLDMGFMRSAVNEDRGGVVLGAVIRMLQGLDTPIIAEGVETLEQAEMLKNMGCRLMQGFHFSRPMPISEFESFVVANRTVENARGRMHIESHLEELTSMDVASSYLFNHGIGPTVFFFAADGVSESILVNDEFYEACGLPRTAFGNKRINPIAEIEQSSRATMWRATAEAREYGAAVCRAQVRLTHRWFDGVIRYLGQSSRGDIFSLNIVHSGERAVSHENMRAMFDLGWNIDMLDAIVPNGFVKCHIGESLEINYLSPRLYEEVGLSETEFIRRFHNSFDELVVSEDSKELMDAIGDARRTGNLMSCDLSLHYGYANERRDVSVSGHVETDSDGMVWLYLLVMFQSDPYVDTAESTELGESKVTRFDYVFETDLLTIQRPETNGQVQKIIIADFLQELEMLPDYITKASAAKLVATASDLRQHPVAGYSDIKCNFHNGEEMRWYHINYTCDADENGNTIVVHGYAQDANDQMGSIRWWRRQAEIDQLTGLLNRNAVEQNINLSIRMQGCGMMFMIDLDGFKQVNDVYGHLAGDALLRDVAGALSSNFRESDVLGRYGGDEFVAFMAYAGRNPHDLAHRRAQSIIDSVAGVNAACSVGVALCNRSDVTFYDLLEVADEAMYRSKERGKGTYTVLSL